MQTLLLQDWITLSTSLGSHTTQGASSWLEMGAFEDVVFFLDVKQQSGVVAHLTYQTAPVPQDSAFVPLLPSITLSTGTRADAALAVCATTPIARFLRWQLFCDGATSVTFRIWVAAYSLD